MKRKNERKIYKKSSPRTRKPAAALSKAKLDPPALPVNDPAGDLKRALALLGGSKSDAWNSTLANQILDCVWVRDPDDASKTLQATAALTGAVGTNPKDELEGMLATQILAAHNATMECYRQATVAAAEGKNCSESLSQASKFSRTYATLLEVLNRHRGKVQPVQIYISAKRGARG
jgi:hypothetical protein